MNDIFKPHFQISIGEMRYIETENISSQIGLSGSSWITTDGLEKHSIKILPDRIDLT